MNIGMVMKATMDSNFIEFAVQRQIKMLEQLLFQSAVPSGIKRPKISKKSADAHPPRQCWFSETYPMDSNALPEIFLQSAPRTEALPLEARKMFMRILMSVVFLRRWGQPEHGPFPVERKGARL